MDMGIALLVFNIGDYLWIILGLLDTKNGRLLDYIGKGRER